MKLVIAGIVLLALSGCSGCSDRDCSGIGKSLGICDPNKVVAPVVPPLTPVPPVVVPPVVVPPPLNCHKWKVEVDGKCVWIHKDHEN